jgi:hypothetical protein
MDMHLPVLGDDGERAELWFEHKVDTGFGPEQLDNYEKALRRRRAKGHVIHLRAIVVHWPSAEEMAQLTRMGAEVFKWNEVADVVDEVLARRAPDWYLTATRLGAAARLRVVAELAVYLQEVSKVAVNGPFDNDKLGALQYIQSARRVAGALLERVGDRLQPSCHDDSYPAGDERWLDLWATGWWNGLPSGGLYLWIAPTAWFANDADPVPSFGVSVHVDKSERARLTNDGPFRAALDAAAFQLRSYWADGTVDIAKSAPLAGVVDRPRLREQVDVLATFARSTIAGLARCVPAGTVPGAPPAGRLLENVLDTSHLD